VDALLGEVEDLAETVEALAFEPRAAPALPDAENRAVAVFA
jgi:hypothetical protein